MNKVTEHINLLTKQISGIFAEVLSATVKDNGFQTKDNATLVKSNTASVKSNAPSVKNNTPSVKSNTASVKSNTASVKNNAPSVKSNTASVKSSAASVKMSAPSVKKNTASVKEMRSRKKNMLSPEIIKLIITADAYLHYANGLMFYIGNDDPAAGFIIFRFNSDGVITGFILVLTLINKQSFLFLRIRSENANVFDGVIERYCGVPP
ncbi:MAG TPA: hypothetical protein PKA90_12785 [Ignavibacteria bacterium]|nr:hypothetical protein [Ignavibacteria bacterium]